MLRKVLQLALVGMLVMGLMVSVATSQTIIRHWQGDTPFAVEWVEILIERFEKAHPEVKIETEYIPVGNMAQKVMIAIASDTTPDTLKDYIGRMSSWWKHGALESLSGTLSKEDLQDFYPSLIDLCKMDGQLIGYPWPLGVRSFGANMTLLERAGVAELVPSGENREWSLETFEQAAEKVSQFEGVYGTGFFASGCSGDYHMLGWFQSFGAYLYEDGDHTRTGLNTDAGVRALEWMIDLVDKSVAAPGMAGTTDDHHVEAFWSGKIGFGGWVPTEAQAKGNYESGMIDYLAEYRLLEFPHVEGVTAPPIFIGNDVASVFKDSEVKELAIEWTQCLASKEALELFIEMTPSAVIPSRRSIPAKGEYAQTMQRMIAKNGVGDLGLTSEFYLEVRNAQYPEFQAAFTGIKTPRRALDDFAKAVREICTR